VLECSPGRSVQVALEHSADLLAHRDAFVDSLAAVHAVPLEELPPCLPRPASWDAYLEERIGLWAETEGALAEASPIMRYVGAWLASHRPPPMDLVLCHGDYQAPNALLQPDAAVQLIDWEFAHIGDPREDLGWYVVVSAASPPSLYSPDPGAFLTRYRRQTGADEIHVNEATVGYFSMVAMVKVFAGIVLGASAMARGLNASVLTTYNLNAIAIGHMNCLDACAALAEPLASLRDAARALELQP
jgi:aminoglycoside phosphotransferase (APT) family kinase protein